MGKRGSEPRPAPWRQYVLARADVIQSDMEEHFLALPGDDDRLKAWPICIGIRGQLDAARDAAGREVQYSPTDDEFYQPSKDESVKLSARWWQRLLFLSAGSSIECAFRRLHAARIMMVWLLPLEEVEAHIPDALARLRKCLSPQDPNLTLVESELRAAGYIGDGLANPHLGRDQRGLRFAWAEAEPGALHQVMVNAQSHTLEIDLDSANPPLLREERNTDPNRLNRLRAIMRNILLLGYNASDELHARVRSFRNIVAGTTAVLTLLTILVVILGGLVPDAIPLCFTPDQLPIACPTGKGQPTGGDIGLVAALGLLGAALSAALAIRRLSGTSTPYQIPVVLSCLKLPLGALTSVLGLLFVHGGFVPGFSELDTQDQILAYAVLFGFAQQLATRLIDRQAEEVVGKLPSKDPSPGGAVPGGAELTA